MPRLLIGIAGLIATSITPGSVSAQVCSPDWLPTFSGGTPGSNRRIEVAEILDFGAGP